MLRHSFKLGFFKADLRGLFARGIAQLGDGGAGRDLLGSVTFKSAPSGQLSRARSKGGRRNLSVLVTRFRMGTQTSQPF